MTSHPPEGIIFDFEGTLVDFQWRLAEAEAEAKEVLVRFGIMEPEEKLSYAEMMNRVFSEEESPVQPAAEALLGEIYDRYDADALSRWQVRPGAVEVLEEIRRRGLKSGLVSNVGRVVLDAALERVGLELLIDVTVSRNDVSRLKPDPAGILLASRKLDCPAEKVWYVGDSLDDVRAAQGAGVPVAVIRGGQDRLPELERANPSRIISALGDLITLLDHPARLDF